MGSEPVKAGEFKLEIVVIPVSDVDRAKSFYQSLGWRLDADLTKEENYRIVQLTPPAPPARSSLAPGSPPPRLARSRACSSRSTTSTRPVPT